MGETMRSFNHGDKASPFSLRPTRKLRVVVDMSSAVADGSESMALLLRLLEHEFIDTLFYGGFDVPMGVPRSVQFGKDAAPVRWIEVESSGAGIDRAYFAQWSESPTTYSHSLLSSPFLDRSNLQAVAAARSDWTGGATDDELFSGSLMRNAAKAADADIVITPSKSLSRVSGPLLEGVATIDPGLAIAFVGLYLRSIDRCVVIYEKPSEMAAELSRGLFYRAASRIVCPSVGSLYVDILHLEHAETPTDGRRTEYIYRNMLALAGAVSSRVARCLMARDGILIGSLLPESNMGLGSRDQVAAEFDSTMVLVAAAFDALAGLCDAILDLGSRERDTKWQNDQWRQKACRVDQDLNRVFARESNVELIRLLGLLRNEIHGEGIEATEFLSDKDDRRLMIGLSSRRTEKFFRHLSAGDLGGAVETVDVGPYGLLINPLDVCSVLIPKMLDLLNQIANAMTSALRAGNGMPLENRSERQVLGHLDLHAVRSSVRMQLWMGE